MKKHIGIFVPFHLRGGDGDNMVANFSLLNDLPYDVVVGGSEGDHSAAFAARFPNLIYREIPQKTITKNSGGDDELRKKFNNTLAALMDHGKYHWYCFVGANDIICYSFWKWLETEGTDYPAFFGIQSDQPIYMASTKTGETVALELKYKEKVRLIPGVNAFNHTALAMCDNRPYQLPGDEIGAERLGEHLGWIVEGCPGWVCAVKGSTDLNKYDDVKRTSKHRPLTKTEYIILKQYGI